MSRSFGGVRVIIGADPGKAGAFAFISEDGTPLELHETPVITSAKGKPEYDERAIRQLLLHVGDALVAYEALQTLPPRMGGGIANFQRGLAVGLLRGLCAGLALRSVAYRPQAWQKEMLAGAIGEDTKQRSLIVAGRLFPGVCLVCLQVGGTHGDHGRKTKPRDGAADALLIAEYARRRVMGLAA